MRFALLLSLAVLPSACGSAPQPRSNPSLRTRGGTRIDGADASSRSLPVSLVAKGPAVERRSWPSISKHLRGLVFGGMDGTLTTFALLAAVEGSKQTSSAFLLVIGISTVLADALSMAAGEYLSAKAEMELHGAAADEPGPLEKGLAMFVAFTAFGSLPLIGCVASTALSRSALALSADAGFPISVAITAATLFALGAFKSHFGAGIWWQAGFEVAGIGGAAACVAFFTARVVERLLGDGGG